MPIIRIAKRDRFTVIANSALEDNTLSLKAKGLLAYLLSKPEDWTVVSEHLATIGPDKRIAIRSAMRELKNAGYATLETPRGEAGRLLGQQWTIHERPITDEHKTCLSDDHREAGFPSDGKSPTTKDGIEPKKEAHQWIPDEMNTPEFSQAWQEWWQYRIEKRQKLTPTSIKKQIAGLKEIGTDKAIECLNDSMKRGWTGIWPEKFKPTGIEAYNKEKQKVTRENLL